MAEKNHSSTDGVIDCACVIHSNGYDWQYVDKLFNMLSRNLSNPVRLHVYTEPERTVPPHMIKHNLIEWPGIAGPKKSWWYKMQLFNPAVYSGQILYFDLDVVITNSIDWITVLPQRNFWAIHDFRRLWKKTCRTVNSSVMYFDTREYEYVWTKFQQHSLDSVINNYKGDQDFITEAVNPQQLRYFDLDRIVSWRWQAAGNPYQRQRNLIKRADTVTIPQNASVLIFHGDPKPHQVDHQIVQQYWC